MSIVQDSYSQRYAEMKLGQLMNTLGPSNGSRTQRIARGLVKAGYGCFKVQGYGTHAVYPTQIGQCYHIPNPDSAVDVDAFLTATATSASIVTHTSFNGVVGTSDLQPARKLTFTLSSHADFNAVVAVVTYLDQGGRQVSENVNLPDAGNATVTTTGFVSKLISVVIPAQGGTGGSYTIGIAALAALTLADYVGVAIRIRGKHTLATSDLYRAMGGSTSNLVTADYIDNETVRLLETGDIAVYSEEAVADRDPVYVRIAAGAGGSVLGAYRNDADTASAVLVPGARFVRDATGAGPAWVSFKSGW
jgi:hypothetical protein